MEGHVDLQHGAAGDSVRQVLGLRSRELGVPSKIIWFKAFALSLNKQVACISHYAGG